MRRWTSRAGLVLLCGLAGALAGQAQALAQGPAITAITPNNGPAAGGTSVTVTGTGFTAGSTVTMGTIPATHVQVNSPQAITATSPRGAGTVDVRVTGSEGASAPVPVDQFAYDQPPRGPWLGLNGNSSTYLGPVDAFVEHDIVYDRNGTVDWAAGAPLQEAGKPTERGRLLATDIHDGMIPVIAIEYRGYSNRFSSDPKFPTEAGGSATLSEYVEGFVSSVSAILAAHPGKRILFEPINEPWGYTTPQYDGAQYADVIARLLPAARAAHIPLSSIYVAAFGRHWVSEMYRAQPSLQREVQGWYFHPYGLASGSTEENSQGIRSLPHVQAEMTSGQNNIIVSEVGFCALDVNHGQNCSWPYFKHSETAADELTETLESARPYHDAGWLKALLVYSRNDGGWAMQLPGGALTDQGEALQEFADALKRPPRSLRFVPFGREAPRITPLLGRAGIAAAALGDFYVTAVSER
jgi:hypothetical protein